MKSYYRCPVLSTAQSDGSSVLLVTKRDGSVEQHTTPPDARGLRSHIEVFQRAGDDTVNVLVVHLRPLDAYTG